MSFPTKGDAVEFVIHEHLGRRSLTYATRAHLPRVLQARAKQLAGQLRAVTKEMAQYLVNTERLSTRQAAGQLGVGQTTIRRYVVPEVSQVAHSVPDTNTLDDRDTLPGEWFQYRDGCPICPKGTRGDYRSWWKGEIGCGHTTVYDTLADSSDSGGGNTSERDEDIWRMDAENYICETSTPISAFTGCSVCACPFSIP